MNREEVDLLRQLVRKINQLEKRIDKLSGQEGGGGAGLGDTDDLAEGSANLYYTTERAQDAAGGMFSGNTETGISATYDDGTGKINLDAQTAGDARYAPIAKGVTNGDSHDHNGGDGGQIDHGGLAGLSDDDHNQYVLLAGRSGGQTLKGGTGSGDDLTLESTNHATKGEVILQPNGGNVYMGTDSPGATASNLYIERDGNFCALHLVSYRTSASGARNTFNGYAASGSKASPAALVAGQTMFRLTGWAHDTSTFQQSAMIEMTADLNHGSGDVPGRISLLTTPDGGTTPTEAVRIDSSQNVMVGSGSPTGKLHVDQSSTTAAIPVLVLEQLDVSEPMIELACTIGTGNGIEAVGAKTLTTTHFIKVLLPGGLTRYIPCGTIA